MPANTPLHLRWLPPAALLALAGCASFPSPGSMGRTAALPPAQARPAQNPYAIAAAPQQQGGEIELGGQAGFGENSPSPGGDDHYRLRFEPNEAAPSGVQLASYDESPGSSGGYAPGPPGGAVRPAQYQQPGGYGPPPGGVPLESIPPGAPGAPAAPFSGPPLGPVGPAPGPPLLNMPQNFADIDVFAEEARTGRLMFGVGVNSEAGLTGQIVIDERNFDIRRIPTSFDDFVNGTAFRGGGQGFRVEALPGNQVQRYLVSFTEPYLFDTPISLNVSGFFYGRGFLDWNEQRLGGRLGLGYYLTPDLAISAAVRAEAVDISGIRVAGIPELEAVRGDTDLYTFRTTLTHDTRDTPFAATEGHYIELAYEQGFGEFDYPRGDIEYRRYFLIRERPDGSGRHTISSSHRVGFTGSQTPIFENYFAGGFSTLRGFQFRGASPQVSGVTVGGEFSFLGSLEYMFPLTADDMVRGVVFVDYGTIEEKIQIESDDFRLSPGVGLRISIPALGPAPLAFDFSSPLLREDTDQIQVFSFFFGFGR